MSHKDNKQQCIYNYGWKKNHIVNILPESPMLHFFVLKFLKNPIGAQCAKKIGAGAMAMAMAMVMAWGGG